MYPPSVRLFGVLLRAVLRPAALDRLLRLLATLPLAALHPLRPLRRLPLPPRRPRGQRRRLQDHPRLQQRDAVHHQPEVTAINNIMV